MVMVSTEIGKIVRLFCTQFVLVLVLSASFAYAGDVSVRGYFRRDGTYVQPHYRSQPDGNPYNNWSFPGNVNPYTGKVAPGNPDTYLKNYYNKSLGSFGTQDTDTPGSGSDKIPALPHSIIPPAATSLAPSTDKKPEKEKPDTIPNASVFNRASRDCGWAHGSAIEDRCIRDRMQAIENIKHMEKSIAK